MPDKATEALNRMDKGYNCAQAVFCAFADEMGLDEEQAFKMSEAFGGGMGGMQQTCGALVGAYMAAGLKKSDGKLDASKSKKDTYATVRQIAKEFEQKNTTTICRELKGSGSGNVIRSCRGCVEDATAIAEQIFSAE